MTEDYGSMKPHEKMQRNIDELSEHVAIMTDVFDALDLTGLHISREELVAAREENFKEEISSELTKFIADLEEEYSSHLSIKEQEEVVDSIKLNGLNFEEFEKSYITAVAELDSKKAKNI